MDVTKKIDAIRDVLKSIQIHKTTILVGDNGCGKSVVRKMLGRDIVKIADDNKAKVKSISMQARTASNPEWGALSNLFHDVEWNPTSLETFHLVDSLLKIVKEEGSENWFFIIDEPEIGMSRESQLGLANFLKEVIPVVNEKSYGMLIITHSEFLVSQIKEICEFINMSDRLMNADSWINREIVPTDFKKLADESEELYHALRAKQ